MADFHLGHSNSIRFCNRPFTGTAAMDETSFEQIRPSVKLKVNSITRLLLHAQAEGGPHQRIRVAASNRGIHERVILMIEEPLTWAKELAEVTCGPLQTD